MQHGPLCDSSHLLVLSVQRLTTEFGMFCSLLQMIGLVIGLSGLPQFPGNGDQTVAQTAIGMVV
jgi:hypothetical protein